MAILGGSVVEVVDGILGTALSTDLNPTLFKELVNLQQALRELAAAADTYLAAQANSVEYITTGNLDHKLYLSSLTSVDIYPDNYIQGAGIFTLYVSGGVLRGAASHGGYADAIGFTSVLTGPSTKLTVSLLGLGYLDYSANFRSCLQYGAKRLDEYYGKVDIACSSILNPDTAVYPATGHYRVSTIYNLSGITSASTSVLNFNGATWFGTYVWKNGPSYAAVNYIGHSIGVNYGNPLIFFQPYRP